MSDEIRLPVSRFVAGGGSIKRKRGGTGKISNSGNAPKRFHAYPKGVRVDKKPGKHGGGRLAPRAPHSPAIWNPLDPFIIAYQEARHAA